MPATDLLLSPPPLDLLASHSLFLDFDGTLVEIRNFLGEKRVRSVNMYPGQLLAALGKGASEIGCRQAGVIFKA